MITDHYDDTKEIRRRLNIAKYAMVSLEKIWKDKGVSIITNKPLNSLVFSIASYGAECWVLTEMDRKRIDSFGM